MVRRVSAGAAGTHSARPWRLDRVDSRPQCKGGAMRPVYMISGGITKFAKAHPDKDFRLMVKEALDYALHDLGGRLRTNDIDGSVISYFSDHFTFQLKAGAMVQDYVGLCPKPHVR